ncbi:MAG: hypothetical protein L3J93_06630, partial [Thermoplasmata archaeon]|nr:hypothetical protein [Thermoplasmata archaeon]
GGICSRCGQTVTVAAFGHHEDEIREAFGRARDAYAIASSHLKAVKEERGARERFERVQASWEAAEQRRGALRGELARAEVDRERAEQDLAARRTRRTESESAMRFLTPQRERLRAARDRCTALESDRRTFAETVASLTAGEEAARGRGEALTLAVRDRERIELDRAEVTALLSRLDARREGIESSLRGSESVEDEIETLREERRRITTGLEEAIGRQHRADAEQRAARERVGEAERGVVEKARIGAEADRFRRLAEFLQGSFREKVLGLEHRLLGRAQTEFNRSFSRFFSALLEDPSLVARSDAGFEPWVEIEGESTPAEALSGGERTALALAYRLALGEVVRGAGRLRLAALLLDEPTDGFSPEQVQRMGELLAELGIPQLILVSHEVLLGGAADHVIHVRKVAGASSLEEERAAPRPSGRIEQRAEPALVPGR